MYHHSHEGSRHSFSFVFGRKGSIILVNTMAFDTLFLFFFAQSVVYKRLLICTTEAQRTRRKRILEGEFGYLCGLCASVVRYDMITQIRRLVRRSHQARAEMPMEMTRAMTKP